MLVAYYLLYDGRQDGHRKGHRKGQRENGQELRHGRSGESALASDFGGCFGRAVGKFEEERPGFRI